MTTDVLHNVEGTKHWTPDPDITPKQLDEMREEVFERIIVARVGLLLRHPFFGNMATRLRILAADDWCPTAAVDGRNLYFNTQFFNKMNNPRKYYTFDIGPHLNIIGYKEVSKFIFQKVYN